MAFDMSIALLVTFLLMTMDLTLSKRNILSDYLDWSKAPSLQKLSRAQLEFSVDLYKTVANDITNTTISDNVVMSPYSVMSVLSMLYLGSSSVTSDQLRHALHFDNLSYVEVHRTYKKFVESLNHSKLQVNLTLANKIFIQEGINVSKVYEEKLLEYYDASVELVDFENNATLSMDLINTWVRIQTRDKIDSLLLLPPSTSTKILLANAIYFQGFWLYKFDRTKTVANGIFKLTSSETVVVPMMVARVTVPHGRSDVLNCGVLELPFSDRRLSMFILLPDDGDDLSGLDAKLTADIVRNLMSNLKEDIVNVRLPRFKIESSLRLKESLVKLGLTDLFYQDQADLSGLTSDGSKIPVGDVTHRTLLTVNEEGSEAAATTALDIERIGFVGESYFEVDHPFLFFIWDYQINVFLFIGRITRPDST